jgi:threonine dehydrogenase-like Zn-dependent dehydrogenase
MRALTFDGKVVRYRTDLPQPAPAAGEALIRVQAASICQTDLEIAKGYMGFTGILGHEFVGTVEKLGPTAADARATPLTKNGPTRPADWIGTRVVGEINCVCGKCAMCSRGLSSHCTNRSVLGIFNHEGAFAEYLTLPLRNLHLVPEHVSDEEAIFVEPLAAAFQVLRQVPIEKRTRVAVLGDGRLGLLIAQVLARTGCALTLVGHHEDHLALAEKLCTALPSTGRSGRKPGTLKAAGSPRGSFRITLDRDLRATREFDVVVDCAGSTEGLQRALALVRPRGTIVLKTTVANGAPLNLAPVVVDEITIVGSRCGPFSEALQALAAREISVTPLITKRVSLEQAAPLFAPNTPNPLKTLIRV